jgi:hypothetical protein
MPNPSILPPWPDDEFNAAAQDAFNRMRRAHERGTGCHLTAEMIAGLAMTQIAEIWSENDPRDLPSR